MSEQQLLREIQDARQTLTDLENLVEAQAAKIERLKAEVDASLAGADLDSLPDVALEQAKASVELMAAQRVHKELSRRVEEQRQRVEGLQRAHQRAKAIKAVERTKQQALKVYSQLLPLQEALEAVREGEAEFMGLSGVTLSFFYNGLYDAVETAVQHTDIETIARSARDLVEVKMG